MIRILLTIKGEINNLMGVDIQEVSSICRRSFNIFAIPLSISIGVYLLWQYLGPSSLTLFAVTLAVSPLTTFVSKRMNKFQTIQMSLKDKRMEQLSEILNNIKLLKLFGWEKPFMARVTQTRAQELNKQMVVIYYFSGIVVLWIVIPMFNAGINIHHVHFVLWTGINSKDSICVALVVQYCRLSYLTDSRPFDIFCESLRLIQENQKLLEF